MRHNKRHEIVDVHLMDSIRWRSYVGWYSFVYRKNHGNGRIRYYTKFDHVRIGDYCHVTSSLQTNLVRKS